MATGGKDRGTRAARERARIYQARRQLHESRLRRRSRDTLIAALAAGLIIAGAAGAQALYFTAGPGTPLPTETTAPTPSPTTATEGATPEPTPAATDPATPAATPPATTAP